MQDDDRLTLLFDTPATAWEEASPIGNGSLGAMIFGRPSLERIQFNHDTLWTGRPHVYDRAGASDVLPRIRELVAGEPLKDSPEEAELLDLVRNRFLSDPVRQKRYQPFGDIEIACAGHDTPTEYTRRLDLRSAIATTDYAVGDVRFTRRWFASFPARAIVGDITASGPGAIDADVRFRCVHAGARVRVEDGNTLILEGTVVDPTNDSPGLRFEARLVVSCVGGRLTTADDSLRVIGADRVEFRLVAATSFVRFDDISADPRARCVDALRHIAGASHEQLRTAHVDDHRRLFDRVSLRLGNDDLRHAPKSVPTRLSAVAAAVEPIRGTPGVAARVDDAALIEQYFQFGRYLLIASSRPGSQPANLQGIWNELVAPPWESKWTTNINLQMNYWPAETTGLGECHEPLFDLIDDLRITGGRTAASMYHARGWVLHHNTDLWRGTAPINNADGVWPTGAAWLCHHLWERFLFDPSVEFLRDRLWPALREASLFFLDTLVVDARTGSLVTNPSHSPEQAPPGRALLTAGPTTDIQLIRSLFTRTLEAAALLNIDEPLCHAVRAARAQLPPGPIGRHGQLQEWLCDWDDPTNNHRHMSPLWALHPGRDITPASPAQFAAARTLLAHRGDGTTGWSMAWRMCLWARAFDGEMALRQLQLQLALKTCPNLFDKCGPFQIDGNFGATAGIVEMLLQASPTPDGVDIHLLPALPAAWKDGSVRGLRTPGGCEVDIDWTSGTVRQVTVRARRRLAISIRYGERRFAHGIAGGETITLDARLERVS
jgi:alpha-L-fucosidase 2